MRNILFKTSILSLLLFFVVDVLPAQTIKGKLIDQNGTGLSGMQMQLYINPHIYFAISTIDGSFVFNNITNVLINQLPSNYEISNNYPNPFNPTTRINIILPQSSRVKIELYNILGQKVGDIIEKQFNIGSNYIDIKLDGLPNGIYLARINIDDRYIAIKKMMLIYGSQHLNNPNTFKSTQLKKNSWYTKLDSIVVTGPSIVKTVFKFLPDLTDNILDLGSLTIQKEGSWEIVSTTNYKVGNIFFTDPNNGWAVGMIGTIIHTSDGGENWTLQNYGTNTVLNSVCFVDDQIGFVTGNNNTLFSTTDGGNNWKFQNIQSDSSSTYYRIHYDDNNNIIFITNYGEIIWSTDLGKEWKSKYKFRNLGYSYVYFPTATCGFAMQSAGVYFKKTTDGGDSWNTYKLPVKWTRDIFFLDENNGWFTDNWLLSSTIHDSSTVYYTNNGGETWIHQVSLKGFMLTNIYFVDTKNGWISDEAKILHTVDGGESWKLQYQNNDNGYIKKIYFLNESNGWAITNHGYILKYRIK